ncbi:MAG TPA: protein kinase [Polyangiaceae bacterium]
METIEILSNELERLFELDELKGLSQELLGLSPAQVGGSEKKGSFARALVHACAESDAVEALIDAVVASRRDAGARLLGLRARGFNRAEVIENGESVGPYLVLRKLGEGRIGATYLARREGNDVRLKILWREAARDWRGLHRFFTASRLAASLLHPGLPSGVTAGPLDERGDRHAVVHAHVAGDVLSDRLARFGPMRFLDAKGLLRQVLEALAALHERRCVHGDLRLENILVVPGDKQKVLLLDTGAGHVLTRPRVANGENARLSIFGSLTTLAPEQIRGGLPDSKSDLYSFGALVYQLLTGRAAFEAQSPLELLVAQLTSDPVPPSSVAASPLSTEVEALLLSLLQKDPDRRPESAETVIRTLDALGRMSLRSQAPVSRDELKQKLRTLAETPWDEELASSLEATVEAGVEPAQMAAGLRWVTQQLDPAAGPAVARSRQRLMFRAARLFESSPDLESAEKLYAQVVAEDPHDKPATLALERLRKRLGKHEEIVESLLQRIETAPHGRERATLFTEIAKLYANDLNDKEQALVAYTQAFCEAPEDPSHAEEVERLAATRHEAWEEVLSSCIEATGSDPPHPSKNLILVRMGHWYADRVARPDLAMPCLASVLSEDPANTEALELLSRVYRKGQKWSELGNLLLERAKAAPPALARDLKAEAAEILESHLDNPGAARDLYAEILGEDPGHEKATEALGRLHEKTGDLLGYVQVLERRAEALGGDEKKRQLCRIAEFYDDRLNDTEAAISRYQRVLDEEPDHFAALKGLDQAYSKTGRYPELLETLHTRYRQAPTARQKVVLLERMAAIYEEEFLDHARAAQTYESLLGLDAQNDKALTQLVLHYRALERPSDVVRILERHVEVLQDPERKLEKRLALARALHEGLGHTERSIEVYEKALEGSPDNPAALEALAQLRATSGDAERALEAIEALAEQATVPAAKAEQYVRAAQLLERRGDLVGAIERYKLAGDANPTDKSIARRLRAAYLSRGDFASGVELIERELEQTEGDRARGKLYGEMALLCERELRDVGRAESAAKRALDLDPTNRDALLALGHIALGTEQYFEAAKRFEPIANQIDTLEHGEAIRMLMGYLGALTKTDAGDKALVVADKILGLGAADRHPLENVARVHFEHGEPRRAYELYRDFLHKFEAQLTLPERAEVYYRLGESARKAGVLDAALKPLEKAVELDPTAAAPLHSIIKLHEATHAFPAMLQTMYRALDLLSGDERTDRLVEIGDIAASKLNDPDYAAKSYLSALSERPRDRKIMMKLMRLYSEGKDWARLIKVVVRLTDFVEEPDQKAKYFHTASMVALKEMGDTAQALSLLDRALTHDPGFEDALSAALQLRRQIGDFEGVKELLKLRVEAAQKADDRVSLLGALDELGDLYVRPLRRVDSAISTYETARQLDPENDGRAQILVRLYATDANKYFDRVVPLLDRIVTRDPFAPEHYQQLRKLYTDVRQPDGAWCACQALAVLNKAQPDEVRFYQRMRADEAAVAQARLSDRDWFDLVMPSDTEQLLTAVFALIQRAIVSLRAHSLHELGYSDDLLIDAGKAHGAAYALHYAADVLGIELPPVFYNPNDTGGLSFLHAHQRAIVCGQAAINEVAPQIASFVAARHLTYYRPGMYVRQLLQTTGALKVWLFAAMKLIRPQFPLTPDVEQPAAEALKALNREITGQLRDHLGSIVAKLLQQGAQLDLKKWMMDIDRTADRTGFILCHDLQTSVELIRAVDDPSLALSTNDRVRDVMAYSTSAAYLTARRKLGIAVDS